MAISRRCDHFDHTLKFAAGIEAQGYRGDRAEQAIAANYQLKSCAFLSRLHCRDLPLASMRTNDSTSP
jgi:hypothetical protein